MYGIHTYISTVNRVSFSNPVQYSWLTSVFLFRSILISLRVERMMSIEICNDCCQMTCYTTLRCIKNQQPLRIKPRACGPSFQCSDHRVTTTRQPTVLTNLYGSTGCLGHTAYIIKSTPSSAMLSARFFLQN